MTRPADLTSLPERLEQIAGLLLLIEVELTAALVALRKENDRG